MICFLVICLIIIPLLSSAELVHSVSGTVGAGNTSFYRVTLNEAVVVELVTLSGDADLYVSDETTTPSWDHYEAQSSTCGLDSVVIPRLVKQDANDHNRKSSAAKEKFRNDYPEYNPVDYYDPLQDALGWSPVESLSKPYRRPVYIGVYGHPSFELSTFKLHLHILDSNDAASRYYYGYSGDSSTDQTADGSHNHPGTSVEGDNEEGEGSVIWTILGTILRILLELIL